MANSSKKPTYRELTRFLTELGFDRYSAPPDILGYRRTGSDLLILHVKRPDNEPVRDADLASIRRHLIEHGIISDREFDLRIAGARRKA